MSKVLQTEIYHAHHGSSRVERPAPVAASTEARGWLRYQTQLICAQGACGMYGDTHLKCSVYSKSLHKLSCCTFAKRFLLLYASAGYDLSNSHAWQHSSF